MCHTALSTVSHTENKYGETDHPIPVHHQSPHYATLPHLKEPYTSDQIPLLAPLARPSHCQQNIGINSWGEGCFPRHVGIYTLSRCKHTWTDASWADNTATLLYTYHSLPWQWPEGHRKRQGSRKYPTIPQFLYLQTSKQTQSSRLYASHADRRRRRDYNSRDVVGPWRSEHSLCPQHTVAWKLCPSIWLHSAPNARSSGSALFAPSLCYLPHSYTLNIKYILNFSLIKKLFLRISDMCTMKYDHMYLPFIPSTFLPVFRTYNSSPVFPLFIYFY